MNAMARTVVDGHPQGAFTRAAPEREGPVALLPGKSNSATSVASAKAVAPAKDIPSASKPIERDSERLPPRDDSFYLGICFSHW
jgi:hypothetical protein